MADPVLHLLAGPNGSGKSQLFAEVIGPVTHLEFVNADEIAAAIELIAARTSFATETVFSHPSKLDLVRQARAAGYLVTLHVLIVPEDLAVARVVSRVAMGGHDVPEVKVRARFQRLWPLVADAIAVVDAALVYDNSRLKPAFRLVATFDHGSIVGRSDWPSWAPESLLEIGG